MQEVASCFHCGPPPILAAIAGAEVAEECHGRVDLRLVQRPQALFRVREKRSAVAVGVGVSVPADLEGGASGWGERRRPPCSSPSVMAGQARAADYSASTRGVSWLSTMKEPSFSSLRSSHLARLRYVKCSVRVSLTSGQSTFSTVW